MRARVAAILAGLAAVLVLPGCDVLRPRLELELHLAPLPPHWAAAFGRLDWIARWRDPAGVERELVGEGWAEGPTGCTVVLRSGVYTPVLVTPVQGSSECVLRPAGAVSPLDASPDAGSLHVSFDQGPAAWVLDRLLADGAGLPPGAVDMERVVREIRKVGDGDPWWVDLDTLIGSLRAGDLDCRRFPDSTVASPSGAAALSLPTGGCLVWDDPYLGVLCAVDSPVRVPWGFHRLYVCDPAGLWTGGGLHLWVDEHETLWLPMPP